VHVIGIIASDDAKQSWAILDISGSQHMYQAGATLPDGEKLVAVQQDRVVLAGAGVPYSVLWDMRPADTNATFATINVGAPGLVNLGQGDGTTSIQHLSTQDMLHSLRTQLLSRSRLPLPAEQPKMDPATKPPNPGSP